MHRIAVLPFSLIVLSIAACGGTTVAGSECTPGCDNNQPYTCDADGKPVLGVPCGDDQSCNSGVC